MSTSEQRKKTTLVMLRMTPEDRAQLEQRAADVSLPLSAYLLACGLARKTRSSMEDHIVNELRLLGEQQRRLLQESAGKASIESSAVVAELIAAIRRIGA